MLILSLVLITARFLIEFQNICLKNILFVWKIKKKNNKINVSEEECLTKREINQLLVT